MERNVLLLFFVVPSVALSLVQAARFTDVKGSKYSLELLLSQD